MSKIRITSIEEIKNLPILNAKPQMFAKIKEESALMEILNQIDKVLKLIPVYLEVVDGESSKANCNKGDNQYVIQYNPKTFNNDSELLLSYLLHEFTHIVVGLSYPQPETGLFNFDTSRNDGKNGYANQCKSIFVANIQQLKQSLNRSADKIGTQLKNHMEKRLEYMEALTLVEYDAVLTDMAVYLKVQVLHYNDFYRSLIEFIKIQNRDRASYLQ